MVERTDPRAEWLRHYRLIEGAGEHWSDPGSASPALVLGYGAITEYAIRAGLATLGSIYRSAL
jgi:DNA-binding transcriptional MocR family regulator